ncbi:MULTISPECIES: glycosyltransferase family 4 protein [unclassified Acidovorax]|uniref:glycosyltransferase family 4 protein n=1 Tax=unclassified Acidovorax TaxID=2684926 RepID=UPI000B3FC207|nr:MULTISPECIES: glycosyltransferase family 4 protein [unclassified Acidovorax]MBP3981838.1 glycosyltransferase family 4 protein [Acidovorax sp. JG5]MBU4422574.1 glycosyltransferase family 4 protein [Gammaproteobacteria bacterium]
MKVLLFSTLYPSAVRPIHGIFVETRLRELLKTGEVEAKVVAPVPWFPSKDQRFGEYAQFAATPPVEQRSGVEVHHPRYLLLPKVGMNLAPYAMALGALPTIRRLQRQGFDFDLIDAHYYYPDGAAAALLAKWIDKPFVVTARGTDLNLIPQYPFPRKLILETAAQARASIGVCQALMDKLGELGADRTKLHTLRNGVDLERFVPEDRVEARRRLGLPVEGRYLLSVGHLIERKGHHIAIEALPHLPGVTLLIAGAGPEEAALRDLARRVGVADRLRWAGVVPQTELKWWYSAADVLALCSSREGWANVLLEAMACGTPVIATNIWGTPEVVSTPAAGVLMDRRDAQALAAAWVQLHTQLPTREATRAHAQTFSWDATTQGQLQLFQKVVDATA